MPRSLGGKLALAEHFLSNSHAVFQDGRLVACLVVRSFHAVGRQPMNPRVKRPFPFLLDSP